MTEVAITETLGESLSPSQVNTYMTCPAQWYFRYQIVRRRERFSHELRLAYKSGRVLVLKETEEEATNDEKCA